MYKKFQFVATTYAGLEQVLAEELIALGADEVEEAPSFGLFFPVLWS